MEFEVGKYYYPAADGLVRLIKIIERTDNTATVKARGMTWNMTIKKDEFGNEFMQDPDVGEKWIKHGFYSAHWSREISDDGLWEVMNNV